MRFICEYCDKGYQKGHQVSHAKNRTIKRFKPNLHWAKVVENGQVIRRRLCVRCLKKAKRPVTKPKIKKSQDLR